MEGYLGQGQRSRSRGQKCFDGYFNLPEFIDDGATEELTECSQSECDFMFFSSS